MIWVTRILFLIFILASFATVSTLLRSKKIENKKFVDPVSRKMRAETSFKISESAYANLGENFLGSKNLRFKKALDKSLKFLGANTRPDYPKTIVFLSYNGKALIFNEKEIYPLFLISKDDLEESSDYFFEVELEKEKLNMKLYHQNKYSFSLLLPLELTAASPQIGSYKLDNYLLVRQKVCWLGKDLFLKDFGGKEYEENFNSERLDFMHLTPPYYLFAKKGDLFVWKNERWEKALGDSKEFPIMAIEKIDTQMIEVSIWDVTGRQKEKILISKTRPSQLPKVLAPLKFIGAKSNQKWLFKADKARLLLQPGDWLLNLGHKWDKINSIEAIDKYVSQLNMGELFVVKELMDQNGQKILKGDLYNLNRTEKIDYILNVSSDSKDKN